MKYVNGQQYKGRDVRCNDAAEGGKGKEPKKPRNARDSREPKESRKSRDSKRSFGKDEWMQFLNPKTMKLKGEIPNFEEEGWAIRKPRKKK